MADKQRQLMERNLRCRVGRLVGADSLWRSHPVYTILMQMREYGGNAFLCGGACRDLLLGNGRIVPRDLDIIIKYVSLDDLLDDLGSYVSKRTRYGGLSIEARDWEVDVWPLSETWAFKYAGVPGLGLADFGKTTFLNIEAVAVQMFTQRGRRREIYANGFFEAIRHRVIEINFECNPHPLRCVLKSLGLATRYGFDLGPRLARYIQYHAEQVGIEGLLENSRARYFGRRIDAATLGRWLQQISEQVDHGNDDPVQLARSAGSQQTTLKRRGSQMR